MMPQIIVLFGVAGCGKTSVGLSLSEKLKCSFLDADDFHSAENVSKMSRGIPLDDGDRLPWLLSLHAVIRDSKIDTVLACSALKRAYRSILVHGRSSSGFSVLDMRTTDVKEESVRECIGVSDNDDGLIARSNRNWPTFVHLKGNKETIRDRLMRRSDHFMPARLIDSQFEALEEIDDDERERLKPARLYSVGILGTVEEVVGEIVGVMENCP